MKTLLQEILAYVSTSTCRQLAILEYFSDDAERALGPCGLCDRCVAPVRQPSRTVLYAADVSAKAILETVSWCMGRFGMGRIVINGLYKPNGPGNPPKVIFEIDYACPPLHDFVPMSVQGELYTVDPTICNPSLYIAVTQTCKISKYLQPLSIMNT